MEEDEVNRLIADVVANYPWTMGYFLAALQEAAYKEAEFVSSAKDAQSWASVGDAIGKAVDIYEKRKPVSPGKG